MPEQQEPKLLPDISLEMAPFVFSNDPMADMYALKLVTETFNKAETFRTNSHDVRWTVHDSLYLGWMEPKVWEGTNTPRATNALPIVFDQVESALPAIMNAIFGIGPDWFQVEAEPGTSAGEARDVESHLRYLFDHIGDNYTGNTVEQELNFAVKEALLYGNGAISLEWNNRQSRPNPRWVSIKDLYIDPATNTPNVDKSRYTIRRKMMTVNALRDLRGTENMNIPSDPILNYMAKSRPIAYADITKQHAEALRRVHYNATEEQSTPLPADDRIEVLVYYSASRIIWVLNRMVVAYNQPNPYKFIPFAIIPCYPVPGRFYAQSIAEVQEGTQRYMEGLWNAHLDEINIGLHPPRVYKRGVVLPPSQQRWGPGALAGLNDAKDMQILQPSPVTQNVFSEIEFLRMMGESRTGINAMTTSGTPRPSNANRTLGGVQAQAHSAAGRLQTLVKHVEDFGIVPLLSKTTRMTQVHTAPWQRLPAKQGEQTGTIQAASLGKKIKYKMLASSKMMTRDKLTQTFPFIFQFLVNGPVMAELGKSGQTVDFSELVRMLTDATGLGQQYKFVRDLSDEEKQARQQPSPDAVAEQQKQDKDLQVRMELGKMKSQTEIQKAMIQKSPDPGAQEQAQQQAMIEQIKFAMAQRMEAIKQQAARDKNVQERLRKQQELALKEEGGRVDIRSSALKHAQDMQQSREKHTQDMELANEKAKADRENARKMASARPAPKKAAK